MGCCCKPDSKLECGKVDRPAIENRGLALSNGKRGTSRSKKLNLESGVYTELERYLFHDSKGNLRAAQRLRGRLGAAKDEQRDFRRNAEADGSADGAEAAVDVDVGHGSRMHGHRRLVTGRGSTLVDGCREQRALVESGDVIGDETRGTEAMVEDFHLDLAAMRVACERKFDAKLGGAIKAVWIVRKKNIRHVAAHERFDIGQSLLSLAVGSALALIIHADEIELRTFESELRIFVAQELHAGLRIEIGRFVFHTRVNLMVAVAAPSAKGRVQTTDLIDAIGNRVPHTGDEIAGDDREIGAENVGHVHGAAHLGAGHITAQVNVADLDDFHAVKRRRQVVHGNFDTTDLIVQTLGGKTIHGAEKWSGASSSGGGTEKVAAAGVSNGLDSSRDGGGVCQSLRRDGWLRRGHFSRPSPNAFQPVNHLDRKIGKQGAEKPKPGKNRYHRGAGNNVPAAHADAFHQRRDDEEQDKDVNEPCANTEPDPAPIRRHAPKGAVPKSLREKEQRQDAQTNGDAQQQKGPVHSEVPRSVNIKFSTSRRAEFGVTKGSFLRKMVPHGTPATRKSGPWKRLARWPV